MPTAAHDAVGSMGIRWQEQMPDFVRDGAREHIGRGQVVRNSELFNPIAEDVGDLPSRAITGGAWRHAHRI